MAYKFITNRSAGSLLVVHNVLRQLLLDAGWTQFDQVAGQYTVMTSYGEDDSGPELYVKIPMTGTNALTFSLVWDATTHKGSASTVTSPTATISTSTILYGCASKNGFMLWFSTWSGHCWMAAKPKSAYVGVLTTTLSAITTSTLSVTVASGAGFKAGASYQILDKAAGRVTIIRLAAVEGNTLTFAGTSGYAYPAGVQIGDMPYPWVIKDTANFAPVVACVKGHYTTTSVALGGTSARALAFSGLCGVIAGLYNGNVIREFSGEALGTPVGQRNLPDPVLVAIETTSAYSAQYLGVLEQLFKCTLAMSSSMDWVLSTTVANFDVVPVGVLFSGASTGGNTTTTYNDALATWTPGALVGKCLVISSGSGAGQTALITGNTATQLTITPISTIPEVATTYIISDEVYRANNLQTSTTFLIREAV